MGKENKMKKLMFAAAIAASAMIAQADVTWSWWLDKQDRNVDLSFGVASKCANVNTFELSLLYNASPVQSGVQIAFPGINDSDKAQVLQGSIWFNRGDDPCVQLGFINMADAACVQLGFLNFNGAGFLPFFPFFNFSKRGFGAAK